ncbi:MAG: SDR family NAD(P)-dependent oxidoreductase, partial [Candidatus Gracilibacteria bacterium]
MAKILITGGAGFIGSHIAEKLVNRGNNVIVFDNFSTGHKENLKNIKVKTIKGDVRDLSALKKALKGVDYVSHHAAQISVPLSIENPEETLEINAKGTLNVLIAAQENNVKKVVLASSSAVYGDTKNLPIKEKEIAKPLSPYAVSKLIGEYYCQVWSNLYGLN